MNPSIKKDEHVLAIDDHSPFPDMDTVLITAEFYRVTPQDAKADLAKLQGILANWETRAKALGLSAVERAELEDCFMQL